MGTGEDKGGARITGQIESRGYRTAERFVPTLGFVLIFLLIGITGFSDFYTVQKNGVLYYLGNRPPNAIERRLIESWMELPAVALLYDGPEDMRDDLIEAALDVGVLIGNGAPLFVFVRKDERTDSVAVWLSYEGKTCDNFTDLGDENLALSFFKKALFSIFGEIEKPKEGFIVTFDGERLDVRVGESDRPVVFRKRISRHVLNTGDRSLEVDEGFTTVGGEIVYVGRDITIEESSPIEFIGDVDMVYPDGSVFKDGFLVSGNRELPFPEIPLWVSNGIVVFRNSVYMGSKKILNLEETVVDVVGGFLLLSDGSVMDLEGRWRKRVGCTPVEWFDDGSRVYIVDICGNFTVLDAENLSVIHSERFPGIYGFDFLNGKPVLGVRNEVILGNTRKKARDFCVVRGELKTYENDVRIIRTHKNLALVVKGDDLEILGLGFRTRFKEIRIFDEFIAISGDEGTWVVKFPRND